MRGIRKFVIAKFLETLPARAELGNVTFRKNIMLAAMDEFNISIDSASAHYNFAFKTQKERDPASVEGLGRPPEKNNGGRKKKVVEAVAEIVTVDETTVEEPEAVITVEPEMVV